jgi:hypothetical protein
MPLCLLPCDLFPQQRYKLGSQCDRPHGIISFRGLLLSIPDRLIESETFTSSVGQPQPCQFTRP